MPTVLIVEDSPALRVLLADALHRAGYATAEAADGSEGLRLIAKQLPDVVVMDLRLPHVDGMTMLKRMRGEPAWRCVPVIVLTVDSSKATILDAAKLGISAYLLKTRFVLDALLEALARVCRPGSAGPGAASAAPVPAESPVPQVTPRTLQPALAEGAEDPGNALRSLKPLLSRADVLTKVEACEQLKAFSPTVTQLLSLTANPNTSTARIVQAIGQDHALALKMLKLANSVVYTRGEPVTSVKEAVLRIGMDNIRQAVLNISVVDHFGASKFADHLSLAQFWERGTRLRTSTMPPTANGRTSPPGSWPVSTRETSTPFGKQRLSAQRPKPCWACFSRNALVAYTSCHRLTMWPASPSLHGGTGQSDFVGDVSVKTGSRDAPGAVPGPARP